jgi:UDP-N-acetyl-D-mannosaminuronic acid dehydrogenase
MAEPLSGSSKTFCGESPVSQKFETVSVVGLGYVGLPTAATLAARGLKVVGVDISRAAVERINAGRAHIVEPDLDIILGAVVQAGNLRAVAVPEAADAFMVAVPTPVDAESHRADMRAVEAAIASIAPVLKRGDLLIIESTSPVGTTEQAARQLQNLRPDLSFPDNAPEHSDVMIAYCPERILPGQTLRELIENARIVGGLDRRSAERARDLYAHFATGDIKLTHARVAELAKLTENAFRDVNIAFANELSLVCDSLGVSVWTVIALANLHPRVNILAPGPGVGGHCIPIDPWFIHQAVPDRTPLIRTARAINDGKADFVVERIAAQAQRFREPIIALLGLAYKPNVDDLRESPAVHIARKLCEIGVGEILVVEPHIDAMPKELSGLKGISLTDLRSAVAKADVVAVLVAHDAFRRLEPAQLAPKSLVDSVGLFSA